MDVVVKMCQLNYCCGCISLRTGCFIIAALGILDALGGIWPMYVIYGENWNIGYTIFWILFELFVWSTLIFGAFKYHATAVMINLILVVLSILGRILLIILIIIEISKPGSVEKVMEELREDSGFEWTKASVAIFACFYMTFHFISIAVEIYFSIVIYNFYRSLKAGLQCSPDSQ